MSFRYIIGQELLKDNLKRAIKNDNISHSYLFQGPESIGKMKLAHAFAKTLLCEANGPEACDRCSSCLKVNSGNHPDLYIERPEGSSFKKDQIEEIQRTIRILPYEGKRKVYILENVHKMTTEAENSFLKTLEEPPEDTVIIMTVTNNYSLLPTIVSRCQVMKFIPVDTKEIEKVLIEKYQKTEDDSRFIASFSNGIVGKAINLAASQDFRNLREEVVSTINSTIDSEKFRVFSISGFFEDNKDKIEDILDMVLIWFRDILIFKESQTDRFVINKDKIDIISSLSNKLTIDRIHDIIGTVEKTKGNIASHVNYQLAIEAMLLKIQEVL